jgi:uncharacterized protein YkwD
VNLSQLTWNDGLALAAHDHCLDSFADSFTGTDGSTIATRVTQYGNNYGALSQSISFAQTTEDVMTDLFIDDGESTRPNRQNIINQVYNKIGVASCFDEYFGG